MSFETEFDQAFTILLGKAQQNVSQTVPSTTPAPTPGGGTSGGGTTITTGTYVVAFEWGGAGAALQSTTADPILVEVPDSGDIVWVHLYAGNVSGAPSAVSATIDLQRTAFGSFGSSTSLSGSGTPPRIQSDSIANTSLSGWSTHLNAGDTLIARLTSFTGLATFLVLILRVRRDGS